jgi:type III secretory pathway component EscS
MEAIIGIIILIADIWAITQIVQSSATMGLKVIWVLVILFLPLIGLIIWFFIGPKKSVTV